jgi:hypothetical protein
MTQRIRASGFALGLALVLSIPAVARAQDGSDGISTPPPPVTTATPGTPGGVNGSAVVKATSPTDFLFDASLSPDALKTKLDGYVDTLAAQAARDGKTPLSRAQYVQLLPALMGASAGSVDKSGTSADTSWLRASAVLERVNAAVPADERVDPASANADFHKTFGQGATESVRPDVPAAVAQGRMGRILDGVAGLPKAALRDSFDPTFVGAIALSDLAKAQINHDPDARGDLAYSLTTPDFYAGVGIFNASYRGANGLIDKATDRLGATMVGEKIAAANSPFLSKLGAGAGYFKRTLVLAAAMTVGKLVQVDFNGFSFGTAGKDLIHGQFAALGTESKKLLGTRVTGWQNVLDFANGITGHEVPNVYNAGKTTLSDLFHGHFGSLGGDLWNGAKSLVHPKFDLGPINVQDFAITLGSFAAAEVLWGGVKKLGSMAGKIILEKIAAVAGVETIGAMIPGPGWVVDAVVAVGTVVWTAVDLAGLLITANQIQTEAQDYNDNRRFEDAATQAKDNFIAVTKSNGGKPDQAKLDAAMNQLAVAMADLRDYKYLNVAIEDAKYADRLQRLGVPKATLDALGQQVMSNDGQWLAAPGQTSALDQAFPPGAKIPGVTDQAAYDGLASRHAATVATLLSGIDNAPTIPSNQLDPADPSFHLSGNRYQLYDEEAAILTSGSRNITDPTLQKRVLDGAAIVNGQDGLKDAELALLAPSMPPGPKSPGITGALKSGTEAAPSGGYSGGSTSTGASGGSSSGGPAKQP